MTAQTTTKNAEISRRILAAVASGMDLQAAMDSVLGDGAYAQIAGEIYDSIRAKRTA